jgi:acyl-CoA synthetase (AMP-forming)/AMP-acid ligase II
LYLLDRKNDVIITGGANVYPREVEEALLLHPSVAETAVLGISDQVWVNGLQQQSFPGPAWQ